MAICVAATFTRRPHVFSTFGSRQADGTRNPHEATQKRNIVRSRDILRRRGHNVQEAEGCEP